MDKRIVCAVLGVMLFTFPLWAGEGETMDTIRTSGGDLQISFIGHGTLMFAYDGKIIHVDPWSKLADYANLPKADLILITHEHQDHLDVTAIEQLKKPGTRIVVNRSAAVSVPDTLVMANGETQVVRGLSIEAVPAYNLVHMRSAGVPFHPKGNGNGYLITFGETRVLVAGDTENTPELKGLNGVDIAFLPMNLPYTMTPEMVADAALALQPKILYPYHFGETDTARIIELLNGSGIDVRIRPMQ
jgi:L-ascorbate metabolism protein UlaG (beta-lactamase superfamily)